MGGLVEIAGALLERANARSEVAAQNIANITTPGYKSRISFESMVDDIAGDGGTSSSHSGERDWSNGKTVATHNPLDLALAGNGFFVLRSGDALYYTRSGAFSRDANGHLLSPTGMALQGTGGDIVVKGATVTVDADGTIHDGDDASQQIIVDDIQDKSSLTEIDGGLFAASGKAGEVASPQIQQGALEASNVSDGNEMTSIMASLRSAETGQKIVQLYDDLLSQAAGSFGQGAG